MTRDQIMLDAIVQQRNGAMNEVAALRAELALSAVRIRELETDGERKAARIRQLEEELVGGKAVPAATAPEPSVAAAA